MKDLKDMTFNELAENATLRIHSALLEGGGRIMNDEVCKQLMKALQWRDEREDAFAKVEYETLKPTEYFSVTQNTKLPLPK